MRAVGMIGDLERAESGVGWARAGPRLNDGDRLGTRLGLWLGDTEGERLGRRDGFALGAVVGSCVGAVVGGIVSWHLAVIRYADLP